MTSVLASSDEADSPSGGTATFACVASCFVAGETTASISASGFIAACFSAAMGGGGSTETTQSPIGYGSPIGT